jgi:DedD protein
MGYGSKKGGSGDVVLESRHLVGLFVLMVVIFGVVFVLGFELGRNQYGVQVRAATETADEDSPSSSPASGAAKSGVQPAAQPATKSSSARNQPAKSGSDEASAKNAPGGAPPTDYDFYKLGQPNQPPAHLTTPPKTAATSSAAKPQPAAAKTQPAPNKDAAASGAISAKSAPAKTQPSAVKPANSQAPALNAPLIPRGSYLLQVAALTKESDALALAQALEKKKFPAIVLTPGADRFYRVQVGPYADAKAAEAARKALDEAGFKAIVKH